MIYLCSLTFALTINNVEHQICYFTSCNNQKECRRGTVLHRQTKALVLCVLGSWVVEWSNALKTSQAVL